MHFIDDIHFVFAHLWRDPDLVNEGPDVIHRIIRSPIKLINIEGGIFIEGDTRIAMVTRFDIWRQMLAVDRFCKNTGTGGLPDTTGAAKKKCLCKLVVFYGIL